MDLTTFDRDRREVATAGGRISPSSPDGLVRVSATNLHGGFATGGSTAQLALSESRRS